MPDLFLRDGHDAVTVALRGFARAYPNAVAFIEEPEYLLSRKRRAERNVGLVSGGGSGHEPLHAGFLGEGLLDAVAPGQVFASPHNRQVYEASRAAAGPGGVLHIVKNYTGDRINFGIAAERLEADGIPVGRVLVDDDIATESEETATGRRGTAATVFLEKILGASADQGANLDQLVDLGKAVAARSRSVAVASQSLTSVHTGRRLFELPEGQIEYGVGIHGERAARTTAYAGLDALVETVIGDVLASLGELSGNGMILLVNGLGAATPLELYTVLDAVLDQLAQAGLVVAAVMVGTLVSALDTRGFSLSILDAADAGWLDLWHAKACAPGWNPPAPNVSGSNGGARDAR